MSPATLIGQAAENAGLRLRYQADTIRKHRVLSLIVLRLNRDDRAFDIAEFEFNARIIEGKIARFA